ncbi:10714_t:CDS:2 [Entrophospora sp. SA101]|nr:10714_t:CDS:2 [Entrophospora sp. SA101]
MYRKSLSRPERNQVAPPLLTGKTSANNSSITCWILFSKIVTFWAPGPLLSSIGGLNDRQSKQAWREKITLCFIALLLGSIAAFLTMGFQRVLCPLVDNDNPTKFKPYLGSPVLGFQYNIEKTKIDPKKGGVNFYKLAADKSGQDITNLFQRNNGLINECQINEIQKFAAVRSPLCQQNSCVLPFTISNQSLTDLGFVNTQTRVGYDWDHLPDLDNYIVIDGNVLNLNPYIQYQKPLSDDQLDVIIRKVLSPVYAKNGKDATRLFFSKPDLKASVNCLVKKYYAGSIDKETIVNENGTISSNYSQKTQEFTPQQHQAHHYNNYQQHQANKKSKKGSDQNNDYYQNPYEYGDDDNVAQDNYYQQERSFYEQSQDLGYEQPQDSFYGQEQGSAYQQPGIDLYQQPQNTYYEQPSPSSNFEQLGSQFEESKNNFFSKVKSSFK